MSYNEYNPLLSDTENYNTINFRLQKVSCVILLFHGLGKEKQTVNRY